MKIYTRRGDAGQTDLFGGPRVDKDALRVEAYGAVDELNAVLGGCAAETEHADLRDLLRHVQGLLFDIGSTLATPDGDHRAKSGVPEPQKAAEAPPLPCNLCRASPSSSARATLPAAGGRQRILEACRWKKDSARARFSRTSVRPSSSRSSCTLRAASARNSEGAGGQMLV